MSQPCAPATLYMLALFGAGAGVLGLGTADPAPPVEAVSLDAPAHLAALEAPPAEAAAPAAAAPTSVALTLSSARSGYDGLTVTVGAASVCVLAPEDPAADALGCAWEAVPVAAAPLDLGAPGATRLVGALTLPPGELGGVRLALTDATVTLDGAPHALRAGDGDGATVTFGLHLELTGAAVELSVRLDPDDSLRLGAAGLTFAPAARLEHAGAPTSAAAASVARGPRGALTAPVRVAAHPG